MKCSRIKSVSIVLLACLSVHAAGGETKRDSGTAAIQPKGAVDPMYLESRPTLPSQIRDKTARQSTGARAIKAATKHVDVATPITRKAVHTPQQTKVLTESRTGIAGPVKPIPNVLERPQIFAGNTSKVEKIRAGSPGHVDPKSGNRGLSGIYAKDLSNAPGLITTLPGARTRLQQLTNLPGFGHRKGFNPSGFDASTKSISPLANPKSPTALGLSPTVGVLNPRGTLSSNQGGNRGNGQLSGLSNPRQNWTMNGGSSAKSWWAKTVRNFVQTGVDGPGESKWGKIHTDAWILTSDHSVAAFARMVHPITVYAVGVGSVATVAADDVATGCVGALGGGAHCRSGTGNGVTSGTNQQAGNEGDTHTRDTDGDGVADQSYYEPEEEEKVTSSTSNSSGDDDTDKNKTAGTKTKNDDGDTNRDNDTAKDDESQPRDCAAGWTDTDACHNPAEIQAALAVAQQRTLLGGFVPRHLDWQTTPVPEGSSSAPKNVARSDVETAKKKRRDQVTNPNPLGSPSRYISDEEIQERYRQKQGQDTDPSPEG